MSVRVEFHEGPLAEAGPWPYQDGTGAALTFEGVARPTEEGRAIDALDYDAYRPMAEEMLGELAQDLVARLGLLAIYVEHSTGRVKAGQRSFRLRIASEHRVEGLTAAEEFIGRMKQDVPIFKVPVWSEVHQEA